MHHRRLPDDARPGPRLRRGCPGDRAVERRGAAEPGRPRRRHPRAGRPAAVRRGRSSRARWGRPAAASGSGASTCPTGASPATTTTTTSWTGFGAAASDRRSRAHRATRPAAGDHRRLQRRAHRRGRLGHREVHRQHPRDRARARRPRGPVATSASSTSCPVPSRATPYTFWDYRQAAFGRELRACASTSSTPTPRFASSGHRRLRRPRGAQGQGCLRPRPRRRRPPGLTGGVTLGLVVKGRRGSSIRRRSVNGGRRMRRSSGAATVTVFTGVPVTVTVTRQASGGPAQSVTRGSVAPGSQVQITMPPYPVLLTGTVVQSDGTSLVDPDGAPVSGMPPDGATGICPTRRSPPTARSRSGYRPAPTSSAAWRQPQVRARGPFPFTGSVTLSAAQTVVLSTSAFPSRVVLRSASPTRSATAAWRDGRGQRILDRQLRRHGRDRHRHDDGLRSRVTGDGGSYSAAP